MQAAVDVVCSQMGYDFGSLGSSSCDRFGGNDFAVPLERQLPWQTSHVREEN